VLDEFEQLMLDSRAAEALRCTMYFWRQTSGFSVDKCQRSSSEDRQEASGSAPMENRCR
jgi:hypothetical protein